MSHDILYDLANSAQGWIDWNLIVDHNGGFNHVGNDCDAAIVLNKPGNDFHIQPKFYHLAHFSKYMKRGALRVESTAIGSFDYAKEDPRVRPGIELGMYHCERSSRQMWRLVGGTLRLSVPTALDENLDTVTSSKKLPSYEMCVGRVSDSVSAQRFKRDYLKLTSCPGSDLASSSADDETMQLKLSPHSQLIGAGLAMTSPVHIPVCVAQDNVFCIIRITL